jgi:periplasmic protein TonB
MFDKLVESTNHKTKGRSKFYVVASLIYGTALSLVAVLTIIWFNPGMAEANTGIGMMIAPPPPPPPPTVIAQLAPTPVERWIAPIKPPETIADPTKVTPKPPTVRQPISIVGMPNTGGIPSANSTGIPGSEIGQISDANEPPPPPAPTPKVVPTPAPTPEAPKLISVSTGVLQGKAIRKVQPAYPSMGKAVRAAGAVPVQITISEDGRVIDASVISGHPLLRDAARQAALQWVFSPTVLNGKNVKVSGVISFNFILN